MRHTIIVATLSSVAASILTTAVIGGSLFGADTASSAETAAGTSGAVQPGGVDSILQGDINCDGVVDAKDALGDLRYVGGLAVQQDEPCPDIGTLAAIPGPAGPQGEQGPPGISGYEVVFAVDEGSCETPSFCAFDTSVSCPLGKKALGGGTRLVSTDAEDWDLQGGGLVSGGWSSGVFVSRTGLGTINWEIWNTATCANVAD